mgnify:FL=1
MIKPYYANIIETLHQFQNEIDTNTGTNTGTGAGAGSKVYGGFGGGPMQLSHL